MSRLFYILAVLSIVAGCKKAAVCDPETYIYSFTPNKRVDTARSNAQKTVRAFTTKGDKLVFSYMHLHSPCDKNIADGFVSSSLLFEVEPLLTHFVFTGDDLQAINCYFTYSLDGYSLQGAYHPTGGLIEGSKINERVWSLRFSLTLRNNQSLTGSGKFTMQ